MLVVVDVVYVLVEVLSTLVILQETKAIKGYFSTNGYSRISSES
jgi:hypothetical protein